MNRLLSEPQGHLSPQLLSSLQTRTAQQGAEHPSSSTSSPLSRLNEYCARVKLPAPQVQVWANGGPDHQPIFHAVISVGGLRRDADAFSKKAAKHEAALALLSHLQTLPIVPPAGGDKRSEAKRLRSFMLVGALVAAILHATRSGGAKGNFTQASFCLEEVLAMVEGNEMRAQAFHALRIDIEHEFRLPTIPAEALNGWVRDLCGDGDVESNPGPRAFVALLLLALVHATPNQPPEDYNVLTATAVGTTSAFTSSYAVLGDSVTIRTQNYTIGGGMFTCRVCGPYVQGICQAAFGMALLGNPPLYELPIGSFPATPNLLAYMNAITPGGTDTCTILESPTPQFIFTPNTTLVILQRDSVCAYPYFFACSWRAVSGGASFTTTNASVSGRVAVVGWGVDKPVWVSDFEPTSTTTHSTTPGRTERPSRPEPALNYTEALVGPGPSRVHSVMTWDVYSDRDTAYRIAASSLLGETFVPPGTLTISVAFDSFTVVDTHLCLWAQVWDVSNATLPYDPACGSNHILPDEVISYYTYAFESDESISALPVSIPLPAFTMPNGTALLVGVKSESNGFPGDFLATVGAVIASGVGPGNGVALGGALYQPNLRSRSISAVPVPQLAAQFYWRHNGGTNTSNYMLLMHADFYATIAGAQISVYVQSQTGFAVSNASLLLELTDGSVPSPRPVNNTAFGPGVICAIPLVYTTLVGVATMVVPVPTFYVEPGQDLWFSVSRDTENTGIHIAAGFSVASFGTDPTSFDSLVAGAVDLQQPRGGDRLKRNRAQHALNGNPVMTASARTFVPSVVTPRGVTPPQLVPSPPLHGPGPRINYFQPIADDEEWDRQLEGWSADMLHATSEWVNVILLDNRTWNAAAPQVLARSDEKAVRTPKPGEATGRGGQGAKDAAASFDKAALTDQLQHAVRRVAGRFRSWDNWCDWAFGSPDPPKDDFLALVFDECMKANPPLKERETSNFLIAQATVQRKSKACILEGLTAYVRPLRDARAADPAGFRHWAQSFSALADATGVETTTTHGGWKRNLCQDGDVEPNPGPDGYAAARARGHNRAMHALNGNTSKDWLWPRNMDDIASAPSLNSVYADGASPTAGPQFDYLAELMRTSGLAGPQSAVDLAEAAKLVLTGQWTSAANAVAQGSVRPPEALSWPVQVRNGAAAEDAVVEASWTGAQTQYSRAPMELTITSIGENVMRMIDTDAPVRVDAIGDNGMRQLDLRNLMQTPAATYGNSLQAIYIKNVLTQLTLGWSNDPNRLPLDTEVGAFDQESVLSVPTLVQPQLEYNAATLVPNAFNYECAGQGANANGFVFPQEPPPAGSDFSPVRVAFHTSIATVPQNSAYYIFPSRLLVNYIAGGPAAALAMFVYHLAPYPCGIWHFRVPTTDAAGLNALTMDHIPFSNLHHINGVSDIHILLPMDQPAPYAGNQNAANYITYVQPTFGPAAAGAYVANANMNVSYEANITYYDVANYLATWLRNNTWRPADFFSFAKNLVAATQTGEDYEYAVDYATLWSTRLKPLVIGADGVDVVIPANTGPSFTNRTLIGTLPHTPAQIIPSPITLYDTYVQDMSPAWWNKVASGLYQNGGGITEIRVETWNRLDPLFSACSTLLSGRQFGVNMHVFYHWTRQPMNFWTNLWNINNVTALAQELQNMFVVNGVAHTGAPVLASHGGLTLATAHRVLTGYALNCDIYGLTVYDRFNRPPVGFGSAIAVDGTTPANIGLVLYVDLWVQMTISKPIKALMPFLPPQNNQYGFSGMCAPLTNNIYTTPIPDGRLTQALGYRESVNYDDAEVFNQRLAHTAYAVTQYHATSNPAVGVLAAGSRIYQKFALTSAYTPGLLNASPLTQSTHFLAYNDAGALKLYVAAGNFNDSASLLRNMAGLQPVALSAWNIRGVTFTPVAPITGGMGWKPLFKRRVDAGAPVDPLNSSSTSDASDSVVTPAALPL